MASISGKKDANKSEFHEEVFYIYYANAVPNSNTGRSIHVRPAIL